MGYAGKLEEKELAIRLRKRGLSYNQIKKEVNVSKDTLSRWCRDVILTPEQMEKLLKRKLKGAERGRIIGAKKLQKKRQEETRFLLKSGRKEIGKLSDRDRFLAGVAFYAAEGGKTRSIQFANSDPLMIRFMMEWFREFCQVPESKFRGAIWIHENLDPDRAKTYWSRLTKIPEKQFHKTYIARDKKDSRKIRKNKHEFGVFSIRFSDAKIHRKIMGWISGVLGS